jgi:hypothetical protein
MKCWGEYLEQMMGRLRELPNGEFHNFYSLHQMSRRSWVHVLEIGYPGRIFMVFLSPSQTCQNSTPNYRIYANLMRTSIFKTLKPKKAFAGECNAHRQKVQSLQQ